MLLSDGTSGPGMPGPYCAVHFSCNSDGKPARVDMESVPTVYHIVTNKKTPLTLNIARKRETANGLPSSVTFGDSFPRRGSLFTI